MDFGQGVWDNVTSQSPLARASVGSTGEKSDGNSAISALRTSVAESTPDANTAETIDATHDVNMAQIINAAQSNNTIQDRIRNKTNTSIPVQLSLSPLALGPLGFASEPYPLDSDQEDEKTPPPVPEKNISFRIIVKEPIHIGDKITGHIEYRIYTKTDSPMFKSPEFSVSRRFRDFVWIYSQLVNKYPTVIIPPVPEKMTIGRFQDDFIESRRGALERFCLNITNHPKLSVDSDVQLFLESTTFAIDKKETLSTFTLGEITPWINQPFPKIPDAGSQPQLESKKIDLEILDTNLKDLHKSIKVLMKHRHELGAIILELGDCFVVLSNTEKSNVLSGKLKKLGDIHKELKKLHETQLIDYMDTITCTVEEHIRMVGSAKIAYHCRLKAFNNLQTLTNLVAKRRENLEKCEMNKLRIDKINAAKSEFEIVEFDIVKSSLEFTQMTKTLVTELDRLELGRVEDFAKSAKVYLETSLDTQKLVVAQWKSYFE